jgi:hypothetical protein
VDGLWQRNSVQLDAHQLNDPPGSQTALYIRVSHLPAALPAHIHNVESFAKCVECDLRAGVVADWVISEEQAKAKMAGLLAPARQQGSTRRKRSVLVIVNCEGALSDQGRRPNPLGIIKSKHPDWQSAEDENGLIAPKTVSA